jgi:AcrR family transcriptional regulator
MGIQERKEREKELRREAIIDAAEKVFFSKGFSSATMDEVAETAELSKGTLYLYYKSKEDLLLAVHLRGEEVMYRLFKEAVSTNEPTLKRIINLGEAYYRFFLDHRDYFRSFQFLESPQLHKQASEEMLAACQTEGQKVWQLVSGLIQEGIDEGLFEPDLDPIQASIILWSSGNALMRQMDMSGEYWENVMHVNLEDTMRKSYQFIIEGMLRHSVRGKARELPHLLSKNFLKSAPTDPIKVTQGIKES